MSGKSETKHGTAIEWTHGEGFRGETWNPVLGCAHVSEGCEHCYAAALTSGRLSTHPLYAGLAKDGKFTGEVRLVPERLEDPLRWRRPRMVFVNSMSDLFEGQVPDEFIAQVFAVMGSAERHTFQVLTKRPGRMASLVGSQRFLDLLGVAKADLDEDQDIMHGRELSWQLGPWPLRNVWLGTSVENQKWADIRIPKLLETPAAVRFLSVEPLLGPVDLHLGRLRGTPREHDAPSDLHAIKDRIDWVIVGGESGPGARPMHPDWARSLRDQCAAAGVPFFFKQWGEWAPASYQVATHLFHVRGGEHSLITRESGSQLVPHARSESDRWDLVDRGHQGWVRVRRVGKKRAGRELDGRTWDEMPGRGLP